MRVLRRTDDQVHRQAFHWSTEIWGGEIQLAMNEASSSINVKRLWAVHNLYVNDTAPPEGLTHSVDTDIHLIACW